MRQDAGVSQDARVRQDAGVERGWRAPLVAWGIWFIGALALGSILVLASAPGSTAFAGDASVAVVFLVLIATYSTVGAAIAARRPDHYAGWTLLITGVTFGLLILSATYASPRSSAGAAYAAWLTGWAFEPLIGGCAIFFLLFFPDGHLPGRRWRAAAYLALASMAAVGIGAALDPGTVAENYPGLANPFAVPEPWARFAQALEVAGNIGIVVSLALAGWSLVERYRRADSTERLQIKWVAYVGIGIAVVMPVAALQIGPVSDVAFLVGFVLIAALPLAVAFAILRYRLLEIDRLISRTFVYGALTAILAGVYSAAMSLFQALFVAVTGNQSDAAIVLTTLVLATTLTPIKDRLEDFATHHLVEDGEAAAVQLDPSAGITADVAGLAPSRRTVSLDDPDDVAALEALVERVVSGQRPPT